MSFKYDATGVKLSGEREPLPEGWYPFRIVEAEELQSKKGYPMVLAKCDVGDARYPGAQIWHYVTFIPKGSPGDGINVHFRKAIGVPFEGNDTVDAEDWVGKRFMGFAVQETYEGKTRNKISKISPMREDAPAEPLVAKAQTHDDEIPF